MITLILFLITSQGRSAQPSARIGEGEGVRRRQERAERDAVHARESLRRMRGQGQVRHPGRLPQKQIRG